MKTMKFGSTDLLVPAIVLGCMRITELDESAVPAYIAQCLDLGINFFDHADIYGGGECEIRFARAVKRLSVPRDKMILQSKCGIVPGKMYDFSYDYIMKSVDGILERLGTDYLDILLLHRPDALVEPEEVAAAFDKLESSGKVRYFGVSNHKPSQIELLKKCVKQDIQANQMQLSIPFSSMISSGLEANMMTDSAVNRDGDVLDYCRLNDITIQAWSPFQSAGGAFVDSNEKFPDLNWVLGELSAKYNVTKTTIAAAWILRHPAGIQTIAGTMNPQRISEIANAAEVELTREEWYKLYLSAGHILP
ncbi:MAG: aldo/keto reductase [Ruminococcus sp.]|nr:aldo/keto reductase [Ruminococcus sp.]